MKPGIWADRRRAYSRVPGKVYPRIVQPTPRPKQSTRKPLRAGPPKPHFWDWANRSGQHLAKARAKAAARRIARR